MHTEAVSGVYVEAGRPGLRSARCWWHWSPTGLAVVAVVLAAAAFLTLRTGQLMLNLWLAGWIVFLIHHVGGLPGPTAWARAADTVVGAALAVLVFLLWPTRSTRTLPGLLAEWLRVQDRLLPQLLTGYADVGATDLAALDTLRARSRQVREHLNAAAKQSHAEPAEHRGAWSTAQMDQITTEVSRVAGCATLLREHLPRTAQDTVPELTEPADPLHEHLAALARAAAGAETVAPGRCARSSTRAPPVPVCRRRTSAPAHRPRRPTARAAPRRAVASP
ncbi:hypothetical protein ACGFYM_22250 [Streptomyces sp. NPDC048231]|uniref:hypothetical protein n=1 Tax=Streptomyces sp. NPDC048231 TaxID=3365519 RepID=UPI003713AFC8